MSRFEHSLRGLSQHNNESLDNVGQFSGRDGEPSDGLKFSVAPRLKSDTYHTVSNRYLRNLVKKDFGQSEHVVAGHNNLPDWSKYIEVDLDPPVTETDRRLGVGVFLLLFGVTPWLVIYAAYRCLEALLG